MGADVLLLLASLLLGFDFEAKVPGQLAEVEIPGELKAAGVPVKLKAYLTKESEASLARYYAEAFLRAGLFVPPVKARRRDVLEPQLTAVDRAAKRSYSVLMLKNKDGTVTVVLGEAVVDPLARTREAAFVELPPDAQEVIVSSGEGARTVSFLTRLPPKAVTAFYEKAPIDLAMKVGRRGMTLVSIAERAAP